MTTKVEDSGNTTIPELKVIFNKTIPATIVLDTGATHNFISSHWINVTNLTAKPCDPLEISFFDNSKTQSDTTCTTELEFKEIPDKKFNITFYVVPSKGKKAVIGNAWMTQTDTQIIPKMKTVIIDNSNVKWQKNIERSTKSPKDNLTNKAILDKINELSGKGSRLNIISEIEHEIAFQKEYLIIRSKDYPVPLAKKQKAR